MMTVASGNRKMSVLVVDDNPDSLELVCRMLEKEYELFRAGGGPEALRLAREKDPDLIILDIMMPGMDGFEVLEKLKQDEATRGIPVIFLTARYKDSDRVVTGLELGAFDYIRKPIEGEVLLARVGVAARIKRAEDEARQARQELEHRVRERTAELESLNQELRKEVAEHLRSRKEKELLESQLLQAQKMEAIGTLAGGIAHDFNNILAIIMGYTEIAIEEHPEVKEMGEILKATRRARDLISQILAFSRKAEQKLLVVNPHVIVRETLKMLRSSIPKTVAFELDIDPECGTIFADATQIHQVVINLAVNGVHAMEEKGVLGVSLCRVMLDERDLALYPDLAPGPYVRLSVSDTGSGVSPELVNRIFDPFFTTKDVGKGTGMGLSVVHGIVMAHRGMITVDSVPGKGAIFHAHFPMVESGEAASPESGGSASGGPERILLVDDEDALVELWGKILMKLGYLVTSAGDGTKALELFRARPDDFDLVITDLAMPGLSGAELSRELLKIRPGIPIILCSGNNSRTSEGKGYSTDLTVREVLTKPLNRETLALAIRRIFDGT